MVKRNALSFAKAGAVVFLLLAGVFFASAQDPHIEKSYNKSRFSLTLTHTPLIPHELYSANLGISLGRHREWQIYAGIGGETAPIVTFPISFSYVFFMNSNHHLELGLGLISRLEFVREEPGNKLKTLFGPIGATVPLLYRYEAPYGLIIKAGAQLFYSWPVYLTPVISVGWRF
ncbi:MAG: hypothetical protein GXY75_03410 [Bacteroidales bacterium]|jgi:hypothetical protein|nr:hypothetical protein [Bacteroidales bacterium]